MMIIGGALSAAAFVTIIVKWCFLKDNEILGKIVSGLCIGAGRFNNFEDRYLKWLSTTALAGKIVSGLFIGAGRFNNFEDLPWFKMTINNMVS